ncbi:MAG: flagellar hook-basal body complex protein FliE [Actinomycetota bacterium]|nr:flagellar hook-basal body complex protein FliE [Actinomycetota bacterium]
MPVDPTLAAGFQTQGTEWQVPGVAGVEAPAGADTAAKPEGSGFGGLLADQVGQLSRTQEEAAGASRSLADGTATDVSSVVMAVERAKLSMQLAAQIRNKGVEAYQEIFHTQV